MGIRFRRTMKIAPGIRLNFNKNSIGLSLGPRGAKYTINSNGRRTVSGGIPGSGLYVTESTGGKRSRRNLDQELVEDSSTPGIFSPASERAFYKFAKLYLMKDSGYSFQEIKAKAEEIKLEHPKIAGYIDFVMIAPTSNQNTQAALELCQKLYENQDDFLQHPIATKYFDEFTARIPIARGITYTTDYNSNFLSYTYSEILQATGQPEKALEVIEKVKDSEFKEVATLDLYLTLKRYQEVIDLTNDLENIDDLSALLLVLRGVALREVGDHEIALETFKQVVSKRSREVAIRNFALYERACTYQAIGKKVQAIKDLNKILAADYNDQAAREKLAELK